MRILQRVVVQVGHAKVQQEIQFISLVLGAQAGSTFGTYGTLYTCFRHLCPCRATTPNCLTQQAQNTRLLYAGGQQLQSPLVMHSLR